MSANRCMSAFSRLQRHINSRAARIAAGSLHATSGPGSLREQHQTVCSRSVSSNRSPPKAPDTSLFVPVSLKTESPVDGSVGLELSQPLDKGQQVHLQLHQQHLLIHLLHCLVSWHMQPRCYSLFLVLVSSHTVE